MLVMLHEVVAELRRRLGGSSQPKDNEVVQPPLCLLEGHDHDSVINLAFSARGLDIPTEATRISFQEDHELTLVGRWVGDSITQIPHIESALGPHVDLGRWFSVYLNTIYTVIHPDGRIFHKVELWGEGEQSRDPHRLEDTLARLEAVFDIGNPTHIADLERFLHRI